MPAPAPARRAPKSPPATRFKASPDLAMIVEPLQPLAEPIEAVGLDPANENRHDEGSIAAIAASLTRYGQRTPLVANRSTRFLAKGNGTWLAARKLGWSHVAVVWVADDPAEHCGYRLADNRTAQLSEWDADRLGFAIAELQRADEDLAAALQLENLAASLAKPAAGGAAAPVVKTFSLVIECTDEAQQKQLADRLTRDGFTCKLQTS